MYSSFARLVVVSLLAVILHAAPAPISLKWNELGGAILNKTVRMDLKDGSTVKGVVLYAQPAGLTVQISSNSHPTYKKGEVAIAREQIASMRLLKMRKRGRIIGTTTGAAVGLVGGSMVGLVSSGTAAVGVMIGTPVAAYFIGRSMDRQEILIQILPD